MDSGSSVVSNTLWQGGDVNGKVADLTQEGSVHALEDFDAVHCVTDHHCAMEELILEQGECLSIHAEHCLERDSIEVINLDLAVRTEDIHCFEHREFDLCWERAKVFVSVSNVLFGMLEEDVCLREVESGCPLAAIAVGNAMGNVAMCGGRGSRNVQSSFFFRIRGLRVRVASCCSCDFLFFPFLPSREASNQTDTLTIHHATRLPPIAAMKRSAQERWATLLDRNPC